MRTFLLLIALLTSSSTYSLSYAEDNSSAPPPSCEILLTDTPKGVIERFKRKITSLFTSYSRSRSTPIPQTPPPSQTTHTHAADLAEEAPDFHGTYSVVSKSVMKCDCLRSNRVALRNYFKDLALVWSMQLMMYSAVDWQSLTVNDPNIGREFPIHLFLYPAFIMLVQAELDCRNTDPYAKPVSINTMPQLLKQLVAEGKDEDLGHSLRKYLHSSIRRFKARTAWIPLGLLALLTFNQAEHMGRYLIEGPTPHHPELFSFNDVRRLVANGVFISLYELVNFIKVAFVDTPTKLRLIPYFRIWLRNSSFGAHHPAIAYWTGFFSEWTYRIGLGIFDAWLLFQTRETIFAEAQERWIAASEDLLDHSIEEVFENDER